MATCTCDCCNPDTPTTLNYTTKEINQILADGVINASVRYAPVGQNYLQLTLADALALVPDKERTTVRILTFLNKDTQPKPEVWICRRQVVDKRKRWCELGNLETNLGFGQLQAEFFNPNLYFSGRSLKVERNRLSNDYNINIRYSQ